jgi:putative transcriptional regulator
MDFFKYKNDQKPQRGSFLISEPYLPDPNFDRTVVYLCEHNDEGSFGFVLNKASQVHVEDLLQDVKGFDETVYIGGPVEQNTLHFLHRADYLQGGIEVQKNIFWGGNYEQLLTLIDTGSIDRSDFRFYVGYSGWGEGQLERELEENTWIVANNVSAELIFDTDPEDLWRQVLKMMGGRYNLYSNYPIDPRLN